MNVIEINRPPTPPPATSVTVELTPKEVSIIRELLNYSTGGTFSLYNSFTDLAQDIGAPRARVERSSGGAAVVNTVSVVE